MPIGENWDVRHICGGGKINPVSVPAGERMNTRIVVVVGTAMPIRKNEKNWLEAHPGSSLPSFSIPAHHSM